MIETPGRRDIVRSLSLQGFATSEHNGGVRLTASYKATNVEMRISRDGCAIVKVANGFEALPSGVDLSYLSVVRMRARPLCLLRSACRAHSARRAHPPLCLPHARSARLHSLRIRCPTLARRSRPTCRAVPPPLAGLVR